MHTQTCENASTGKCLCDCNGKLHGRNPKEGVTETEDWRESQKMKDMDEKETSENDVRKAWNNASFSNRLFVLGPVTGSVKNRDEADFASRSSWDELSPKTKRDLLKNPKLSEYSLKYGTTAKSRKRPETYVQRIVRQDRERSIEQKAERRSGETFVVVHHEREDGGFVVRTADYGVLPSPYGD